MQVRAAASVEGTLMGGLALAVCSSLRFRAKREHLKMCQGLSPESQRHNLALTLLFVPYSFESGIESVSDTEPRPTYSGAGGRERGGDADGRAGLSRLLIRILYAN